MKLISFLRNGVPSYGAIQGDRVADFGAIAGPDEHDLVAALRLDAIQALAAEAPFDVPVSEIELLPVVTTPGKIFCVGHNYETHRQETGRAKVRHPSIFTRFADTLTPHGGPIVRPQSSTMLDYEGELAVVIGKGGRHISEAEAMSHVAGFACANDASVRDWQWHTQQFTPGKNFPGTGGLGPWLVTPDEIDDLNAVTVTTRLNGQQVQHASLADLIFPLPTIIAYLSEFTPLSPGDLILTGTPGGVGAKREPPLWMKAGDVVEVEITGIGLLTNSVIDEE
ncbi:5-oxopent-3-ene-1,2,5-tricarboxylate decarboxylase [Caulobacter radicis]|uniref:fumarylacetoacetate hydrolase family protein n=1 Tax=Caulobacter radicis TaxID=2172650 RepID=UPI000D57D820|nr:fumarylacetoacetate hydrolase family protein [Caulobacter radicis]PVM87630.1 5-oxopent-3-ene-1,2,5-tricarboxylate decarboxylase [Caulobacter radicis]